MADSVNPYAIPRGKFPVVAGYIDGPASQWPAAGWAYHSGSRHFTITVTGNLNAMCADVERFDLTPAQGATFVLRKLERHEHPYLYFSASVLPAVQSALKAVGLDPYHTYTAWEAKWDGRAVLDPGFNMKQFADGKMLGTGYDESVIADYLEGLDPLPPQPAPSAGGASIDGWNGISVAVDVDIPSFASQLGVLASGVEKLG